MSVKPVDFQVMIPKTSEVSKITNQMNHKNDVYQQQQAASIHHKVENSLKQVYSKENTQGARINKKQEKDSRNKNSKNRKREKKLYHKSSNLNDGAKQSSIDIRL